MATLVKIKGLDRGINSADLTTVGRSYRGIRVKAPYQQAQGGSGTAKATLTPNTNSVSFTANSAGTWGNNVSIVTAVGTLGVATTYAATTGYPTITVTAPATATVAANTAIVSAVNNDPVASQYVTAALAGTGAAANAGQSTATLASGSNGSGAVLNPIWIKAAQNAPVVVDVDDPQNVRVLRRNYNRFISLGAV